MTGARPPHLLHVFPTFVAAGAQTRVVQLMAGFGDRFRHSVCALDGRTDALELVPEAVEARAVEAPRARGPFAGVRGLRNLIAREAPELLLTYNWGSFDAVLAARSLGLSAHVHHEDGFNLDEAARQKTRRVLARRFGLRRAHRVVVPSRLLRSIALDVWRLPREQVELISNGVHTDRFAPKAGDTAVRDRLGIPREAWVVGAVGHLRPVKCYGRLIAACALLEPAALAGRAVHVLLVGDGPERRKLEAQAERHPPPGGRVHFAGHQDELAPWYRAMDVFAISSDSEQQPVSLLEAMACGVPVAGTDVGDVRAVLTGDGARFLVPATGPRPELGLARAIEALLREPDLQRELADAGRRRVEESFSYEAMLAAYGTLYEGALRASREA